MYVCQWYCAPMDLGLEHTGPRAWLPDETLYSFVSRIHRLSSNAHAETTCRLLFGHPRLGSAHDFPCRIDTFAHRFSGRLGTADTICRERTLLAFYLPWKSTVLQAHAINLMKGSTVSGLKYQLGLLTSRFRANHVLKACPLCVEADRQTYGVAYWHRQHQWPGVWVCLQHGVYPHVFEGKADGLNRFGFELPDSARLHSVVDFGHEPLMGFRLAWRLGTMGADMANSPPGLHLDLERVERLFRDRLVGKGCISPGGRLRLAVLGDLLSQRTAVLRMLPDLQALPATPSQAQAQFARLLRLPPVSTHPLRYLVLIEWLFDSWRDFIETYHVALSDSEHHRLYSCKGLGPTACDLVALDMHKRSKFEALISERSYSVRKAAMLVGISQQTGLEWATQSDIPVQRRPKRLDKRLRARIVRSLEAGQTNQQIAQAESVSVSTVGRVLRSQPALAERVAVMRFGLERERRRSAWCNVLAEVGSLGVKQARLETPADFAWLYRNDREWLIARNALVPSQARGNNVHVDWHLRDEKLVLAIQNAIRTCSAVENRGQRLTLAYLCQLVPELQAKRSVLDRLPRTAKLVKSLCQTDNQRYPKNLDLFD